MNNTKPHFWCWSNKATAPANPPDNDGRTLYLNGTISAEDWFDDDITPQQFRNELFSGSGDITVWVNSPGGDCTAAAQIYNMLKEYPHTVTVKIDGIAASAASVIAMAGDTVLMSPLSLMMLHDPLTVAVGNAGEMKRTAAMLDEVKKSIINAYELKTGLTRDKISELMADETWLSAEKAVELGFADGMLYQDGSKNNMAQFPQPAATNTNKNGPSGRSVEGLLERLDFISNCI